MPFVTLIPGLVSADTDRKSLPGFNLVERFDCFPETETALPFHYSIRKERHLDVPSAYGLRWGFGSLTDHVFYYRRKFFGFDLGYRHDPSDRSFAITPAYLRFPFRIGGIMTAGEHVFSRIIFDLFCAGFLVLLGCAWIDRAGRARVLATPSMNGKTTLLNGLFAGGEATTYLAENLIIVKPEPGRGFTVYPTAPFHSNYGRHSNRNIAQLIPRDRIATAPVHAGELLFAANTLSSTQAPPDKVIDFAFTNSLFFFLQDPLIHLGLLGESGMTRLLERIRTMFDEIPHRILDIKNFRYSESIQKQ